MRGGWQYRGDYDPIDTERAGVFDFHAVMTTGGDERDIAGANLMLHERFRIEVDATTPFSESDRRAVEQKPGIGRQTQIEGMRHEMPGDVTIDTESESKPNQADIR